MNRKVLASLLAVSMTAALMAGCGNAGQDTGGNAKNGSGGGEDGGEASDGGEDSKKLTVWAWDKGFNIPAIQAAAADYKANVDPDFEIEIVEQPGSQEVEQAITLAASGGKYETLPDMVLFQDHWIESYVSDYPDAWTPVGDIDIDWSD